MGLTGQHNSYSSWLFCICHSLLIFDLSTFLGFMCFWRELYAVLLWRILCRVEPSDWAIIGIYIGWQTSCPIYQPTIHWVSTRYWPIIIDRFSVDISVSYWLTLDRYIDWHSNRDNLQKTWSMNYVGRLYSFCLTFLQCNT